MNKGILIGIAVVVAGAAFFGGTQYEKSALANMRAQFARGGAAAGGAARAGGAGAGARGQFGQGGVAAGQIISHDQNGVTLQLMDGSSKIVFVSASTKISKSVDGTGADLVAGQYVLVTGTPNSDGSVTAQAVQLRPAPSPMPSPSTSPATK